MNGPRRCHPLYTALGLLLVGVSQFRVLRESSSSSLSSVASIVDEVRLLLPQSITGTVNKTSEQRRRVSVFYQIFVPETPADAIRARAIVDEQLHQFAASSLFESNDDANITIYYNLIGNQDPVLNGLSTERMQELCRNADLECQQLGYYPKAYEDVTLEAMRQHCSMSSPSNARNDNGELVLYFHSKGSFHDRPHQQNWRSNMMHAITHPDCKAALLDKGDSNSNSNNTKNSQCNVCGLVFMPIFPHFPGNFFATTCRYIRHLMAPKEFARIMGRIGTDQRRTVGFSNRLYPGRCATLALGRYANEHWIASHPDLFPCDIGGAVQRVRHWGEQPSSMSWNKTQNVTSATSSSNWAMAPRLPLLGPEWTGMENLRVMRSVAENVQARRREYFLLPGLLYRYLHVYQQMPPVSSWVWKAFPDTDFWGEQFRNITTTSRSNATTAVLERITAIVQEAFRTRSDQDIEMENNLYQREVRRQRGRACY